MNRSLESPENFLSGMWPAISSVGICSGPSRQLCHNIWPRQANSSNVEAMAKYMLFTIADVVRKLIF